MPRPIHVAGGVLLCAALLSACSGGGPARRGGQSDDGHAVVGDGVVSTVDGHPITVAQVRELAQAGGLRPLEALRRLQAQRLLMGEAERRGYHGDPAVREVARRARVQAVLEQEAGRVQVSDEAIRKAYEAQRAKFVHPELRASFHVLVELPEDASPELEARARELAESMIERLRSADDFDALALELAGRDSGELQLVAQRVPASPRDGSLVAEYSQALFSLDAPGVVAQPVRTRFGYHALAVTEIEPAVDKSLSEASSEVREQLLLEARVKHTHALLERLRRDTPVELEAGLRERVASLSL